MSGRRVITSGRRELTVRALPIHTDTTLRSMDAELQVFWSNVRIFIENGSRVGDKGNIIPHFKILKPHITRHYFTNIEDNGTADNYSTEICESLHKPMAKEAYAATNHKDYEAQMISYLERMEALQLYCAYLAWRDSNFDSRLDADILSDDEDLDDSDGAGDSDNPEYLDLDERQQAGPSISSASELKQSTAIVCVLSYSLSVVVLTYLCTRLIRSLI